jgi:hypothetical protein
MIGAICPISFGGGEEVAMFGGAVEESDGGGETIRWCICFEVDLG